MIGMSARHEYVGGTRCSGIVSSPVDMLGLNGLHGINLLLLIV